MQSPEVMKPLRDFMSQNRINTRILADKMGLTRQNVSHILRNDTVKLSMLESIAEAMDCCLYLSLSRGGAIYDNASSWTPSVYGPKDLMPHRLRFLSDAMAKNHLEIERASVAMGLKAGTVRHWFHRDDTLVRNVKGFADVFGFEFRIAFRPKDSGTFAENNGLAIAFKLLDAYMNPAYHSAMEAILREF